MAQNPPLPTDRAADDAPEDVAGLAALRAKNERLATALQGARDQIIDLKAQLEELVHPPETVATVVQADDRAVDVMYQGRAMRVAVHHSVPTTDLVPGREVLLNEALTIVATLGFARVGEIARVSEVVDDRRVIVGMRADELRMMWLAKPAAQDVRAGDTVIVDTRAGFVLEVLAPPEVTDVLLEEVPEVGYDDIGGLAGPIGQIRDAVELPFRHPDVFREHGLNPPKGVLLYGPPGCGKTLIAKAVAASLSQPEQHEAATSYFINIKGPQLLNKYVGETERQIRLIFARAREKASEGHPVVVFFDEMESLFRTRGSGISSDVETTIVPQLLAEIDGVERLTNVIVIGASNREDMIDPAILRPGRFDVKIRIDRPDAAAAREIFAKYLTADLPLHATTMAVAGEDRAAAAAHLIDLAVERMYAASPENRFLEVTYADGSQEVLHVSEFASGAMIRNIVDRAKTAAVKDFLTAGERGLTPAHILAACAAEFAENEDLPNTANPEEWARVAGKRGERVVAIRRLAGAGRGGGVR